MQMQNEAESMRLQGALLAEGAAGMWDTLADSSSSRSSGLTGAALRGLMAALRKPVLSGEVQLPAACAVWHACMLAKPRERLVQVRIRRHGHVGMKAKLFCRAKISDNPGSNCPFALLQKPGAGAQQLLQLLHDAVTMPHTILCCLPLMPGAAGCGASAAAHRQLYLQPLAGASGTRQQRQQG